MIFLLFLILKLYICTYSIYYFIYYILLIVPELSFLSFFYISSPTPINNKDINNNNMWGKEI